MERHLLDAFCRRHQLPDTVRDELVELVAPPADPPTVRVGPGGEAPTERVLLDDPVLGDLVPAAPTAAFGTFEADATLTGVALDARPDDTLRSLGALLPITPDDVYEDLGLIGRGGTGEVRRVRDRRLDRVLAMKVLWPRHRRSREPLEAFLAEARTGAALDHPGTLPVHELGRFADGRLYFTMPEIKGRTLGSVITEVHDAASEEAWLAGPTGWTFRGLVKAFLRVCETMASAHDEGVLHRDLKPANIMVSAHDVVLVVDWGLARRLDAPDPAGRRTIAGTPAYMPPEQARGELDRLDARCDVYALGAILYEILAGRPPYRGDDARGVLAQVVSRPPTPLDRFVTLAGTSGDTFTPSLSGLEGRRGERPAVPRALVEACQRAMTREPEARPASVSEALVQPITEWLEGARRRAQAMDLVARADRLLPEAGRVRERARSRREAARQRLARVAPWAPDTDKRDAWALDEEADSLERHAHMLELMAEQKLQAALVHDPDLPEAHARLAGRYRDAHARAEAARDEDLATRYEVMVRRHVHALPETDPERRALTAWLDGSGRMTLLTEPRARVALHRYVRKDRRLVPEPVRDLGETPLRDLSLPMGSYLLVLSAPGHATVRYPVRIDRQGAWNGRPPGEGPIEVVRLPRVRDLGPGQIHVPPGWFLAGGDPEAVDAIAGRPAWVDGFILQRDPVTTRAWLDFLDRLAREDVELALEVAPRDEAGELLVARGRDGNFRPLPDTPLHPDGPVVGVTWFAAAAYAAWLADRTGLPWRLPAELEWEKAARGVDGRTYPWGDWLDPSWAVIADSDPTAGGPRPVGTSPIDVSPYGVRGMGGNTQDWCLDGWRVDGSVEPGQRVDVEALQQQEAPSRVYRGGHWRSSHRMARAAARHHRDPEARFRTLGVRLARSWPDEAAAARAVRAA
jgi:eukaryotic-like serine/threonine-protein kinase